MKLKIFFLIISFAGSLIRAQEPYRSLIITEAFIGNTNVAYFEISNVGNSDVQLSEFKFAEMRPWGSLPWQNDANRWFMLPEYVLAPGESYVISGVWEFGPNQYAKGIDGYAERLHKADMNVLADLKIHVAEPNGDETDVVDWWGHYMWIDIANGRSCYFLEHHVPGGEPVVVDQINGWFDGSNGLNIDKGGYDIAGIPQASANSYLIRKFNVKTGNLDFPNAAGVGEDDGEWIVVPVQGGIWRKAMWTTGNHGDYNLDENTLESDVVDVDFINKTLTVPWGIRDNDDIMNYFVKKPGIAWQYLSNRNAGNETLVSLQTGDQLKIWVCGNDPDVAVFDIIVEEPTENVNIVIPKYRPTFEAGWPGIRNIGQIDWPRVTRNSSGLDTITGAQFGLPFALRTDSLLKYLEKAPVASWEFIWVDGTARPDLKKGDKLKVTAYNGAEKEYYIEMQDYKPKHIATLNAITCPDLNLPFRIENKWNGDTIPNFASTVYNYTVKLPFDITGIPAFVAKTSDLNAKVHIERAINLNGTEDQRTVTFYVTAEDNYTNNVYTILLIQEKNPEKVQPFHAEPFLSELVFWEQWSNSFGEIANPGNQPLDLSNYMMAMAFDPDPASVIQSRMGTEEWLDRYDKYVPGYKWVNQTQWSTTPGTLIPDPKVNAIIQPGDVFTFGAIFTDNQTKPGTLPDYIWPVPGQLDVQFNNYNGLNSYQNPWGEAVSGNGSPIRKWMSSNWYLFKILNDSIKLGLKPANDPNDFELIERFGMADGSTWVIGGLTAEMLTNWMRKPEIYKANPVAQGSFGTNTQDTEWKWTNRNYWITFGFVWPLDILNIGNDIGQHFFYEPTHYKSTITSLVYWVSDGYSDKETIKLGEGETTVDEFINNLIKADENQTLNITRINTQVTGNELLLNGDILTVTSADGINSTIYNIEFSEQGLSSDAVLTSSLYNVQINETLSTISGFGYETSIRNVFENVIIPAGAKLNVINENGEPVALQDLNQFGEYMDVLVNPEIYFEVVAEDNVTIIIYQLVPDYNPAEVFVLSQVYSINQDALIIKFIPQGTTVSSLINNLVSSPGATMVVKDKMGFERVSGIMASDDQLVVTSQNGEISKTYSFFLIDLNVVPSEDRGFDYFDVSDYLTVVDKKWTTRSNIPGSAEDGIITNVHSKSTPNSVKIEKGADLIFPMGNKTSGRYQLSFDVYLPTGNQAYFFVSHQDSPEQDHAFDCIFFPGEWGTIQSVGKYNNFFYSYNQWIKVDLIVNLDRDSAIFNINENKVCQWKWSTLKTGESGINQLASLNISASLGWESGVMYFDNVNFKELEPIPPLNIGLVGSFNNWGNDGPDIPMAPDNENPNNWILEYFFDEQSEVKFRNNNEWLENWGNSDFPGGIAYSGGLNIPVPAGYYHINFNVVTGEYNFETINIKCNPQDSLALVAIYNATNGPNWANNANWLAGRVQTWYGVTLNVDGKVVGLNLAANGLNGYIPSEIGNLTEIKKLHLGNYLFRNQFYGRNFLYQQPLPQSMENLVKLEILSLDELYFYQELPDIFSDMTSLRELYIQYCQFPNQSLPTGISSCTNLEILNIQYNNFYDLPDLSGNINLSLLNAYGCYFGFDDLEPNLWIPQFYYYNQRLILGEPESLNPAPGETISRTLTVGGENNIYKWLKDGQEIEGQTTNTLTLENIETVDAGIYTLQVTNSLANQLTLRSHPIIVYQNQLPVYSALEALYNSTGGDNWYNNENWLSNNPITTWFGIYTDEWNGLMYLSLYDNNLIGSLPDEFGDLTLFYNIEIANNPGLTGEIPTSIGQLTNLQNLYLSYNNLTGNIPAEIANCTKLRYFYFNYNKISGLPSDLTGLNLYGVEAQDNKLEFNDVVQWMGKPQHWYSYSPQKKYGEVESKPLIIGGSVFFNGLAGGDGNLYQWFKNNEIMPGQTGSELAFASLTATDEGTYFCQVTNPAAPNLTLVSEPKSLFDVSSLDAYEPDNYFKYAQEISISDYQQHSLFPAGDKDIVWFEITQPSQVKVWFSNGEWGSRQLAVFAPDTTTILATGSSYASLVVTEPGDYFIKAWSQNSEVISEYFLDIEITPFSIDNYEPDNSWADAKQIYPFFPQDDHNLKPFGDADFVKFEITDAPRTITVDVYDETDCRNFSLWLYDTDGISQLAYSDNGAKNCGAQIQHTVLVNGTYYVKTKVPWQEMYDYYTISVTTDGQPPIIPCNVQDSLALVAIYSATNGPNWGNKTNWLTTERVQSWYGVTMNIKGRVTGLNLAANRLYGYIPSEIGYLTEMKKLVLGNYRYRVNYYGSNSFNLQKLPQTLENLTKLEILALDELYMSNELPDIFSGMINLRELYINFNYFNNLDLPAGINSCVNLEILYIQYNDFYDLPDLTGLSKLINLQVYGCYFAFDDIELNLSIPGFIYSGQRLILGSPESLNPVPGETISRTITVGGENNIYQWLKDGQELAGQNTNTLTLENIGTGDAGIYSLQVTNTMANQLTLTSHPLILYQNQLPVYAALQALYNSTGGANWIYKTNWLSNQPITTWYGINVNSSNGLIYLNLNNNNLVGSLPQEFGDLSVFYQIQITYNPGLTGEIPSSIGQLANLQNLYLYNNQLSGNIPSTIGQLTNLRYLYLHNNKLTGDLPAEIGNMSNLYYFNIYNNQIEGIPDEITNCSNLRYLHFYNNKIAELPDLANMDYLYRVYAYGNKLEFDDIVPLMGQFSVFQYAPQDSIGETAVYTKTIGDNFSHTLLTGGDQNQYQWFKDGMLLGGQTSATLEINNLVTDDSGKYYCLVTNPQAPALTLTSRIINLNVKELVLTCNSLNFITGWNIFSLPFTPLKPELDTIVKPLITNASLVKIQDENGLSFEDWGVYGGWLNKIADVSPTEGYKIKVNTNTSLQVCGLPVEYPYSIPLKEGWNIIGYPLAQAFDGLEVVQQLIGRGTLVKVQDQNGKSIEDWGIFGGWRNDIFDFSPGEGYKIKLNADDVLLIYESYPKSSAIATETVATTHFKPEFEGNGVDHMNINLVGLPVNMFKTGDELAVFDGAVCVGSVTLLPRHFNSKTVSIVASAADNQGMPGFNESGQITLKLWSSKNNLETVLEPEFLKGPTTFAKHETTIASLEKYAVTGLDGINGHDFTEVKCYPNPFKDEVTVEINLATDSEISVEVLNQVGQSVKFVTSKQMLNSGLHKISWDGRNANNSTVSPGIYHLRVTIGESVVHRKIVYSK